MDYTPAGTVDIAAMILGLGSFAPQSNDLRSTLPESAALQVSQTQGAAFEKTERAYYGGLGMPTRAVAGKLRLTPLAKA